MGESRKENTGHNVIDTSALYPLILKYPELLGKHIENFIILDLTRYELGNVIRFDKEIKDPTSNFEMFSVVLNNLRIYTIANFPAIGKLSLSNKITFYDAAYIEAAIELGVKLITQDKELLSKFKENAITIDEFKKIVDFGLQ